MRKTDITTDREIHRQTDLDIQGQAGKETDMWGRSMQTSRTINTHAQTDRQRPIRKERRTCKLKGDETRQTHAKS